MWRGREQTVLGPPHPPGRRQGPGGGGLRGGGNQRKEHHRPAGEQHLERYSSEWNQPVIPRHQGKTSDSLDRPQTILSQMLKGIG